MFVGGHVTQIMLAAFGDEVGLGDDGDPEVDQVGDHVVGDDRGVLDAIARVAPGGSQRGERDDKLSVGDTVQRDRDVVVVVIGHPAGELVDVEPVVVQDPLARREKVQPLGDFTAPMGHRQRHHVIGGEVGSGVGETGDPVPGEAVCDVGERCCAAR